MSRINGLRFPSHLAHWLLESQRSGPDDDDFLMSPLSLGHTFRGLLRRPGFTIAAVATLGLGIGAVTAIFSVVYGVLLKPLPYLAADRLVSLGHTAPGLSRRLDLGEDVPIGSAETMYMTYREQNRSFEHVGLYNAIGQTLTGLGDTQQISALAVTDGTLQALGVEPALGRSFADEEYTLGAEGAEPVIVTYRFWQDHFDGDESALGRTFSLDFQPVQIVGVMPASFRFLDWTPQPAVIRPIRSDGVQILMTGSQSSPAPLILNYPNYSGLARLRDGVTLAQANADVARMLPIWLESWPEPRGLSREDIAAWRLGPALRPLMDTVIGDVAGMLWLLMGTVGIVLLVACANIANLLLVRVDARRQELAIRAALGASRRRIAGEIMRESLVLGVLGGAAGLALAYSGLELLRALAPPNLPRAEDISVGLPVLAFAAIAALGSSLAFGCVPVVKHAFGVDALLRMGPRGAGLSRQRSRTRNVLIVGQVALALMLLIGAGLMIRTFQALTAVDPGFSDPESVEVVRIFIPYGAIQDQERYSRVYREALDRVAALPGVTEAGFGFGVPLDRRGSYLPRTIYVEGQLEDASEQPPTRRLTAVSPGHLEALGTRLVAGSGLTWADVEQSRQVVLISENMARELWGEPQAAIGKRIRWQQDRGGTGPWQQIVGVTQNVYEELYESPPSTVYMPLTTAGSDLRSVTYAIRSERAGTAGFLSEVRQAIWASHPDIVIDARSMRDIYSDALSRTSFILVLLTVAAGMALLLSVVGVYGVISYVVSQRSRELGIRLALGARRPAVTRMFVTGGLAVAAIGIAVGLVAAMAFGRWMSSFLFYVRPLDPVTYLIVIGVVLAAASVAAYLPARRAANVDPADTLRAE